MRYKYRQNLVMQSPFLNTPVIMVTWLMAYVNCGR